ncbi:hypothetical protein [Streptomyces sp. HUAS ZL42]|uniref:hypothetical protein n=1 Tax=Streptomyces sp. HUAS ZL42 TaxID=3231715 RepID=UPI00345E299C
MFMRLCTPVSLCLAAAAVLFPGPAVADSGDVCGGSDGRDFPLTARIHGGPGVYEAGGGFGTWYLELANTTGRVCSGVHPVVVLVDGKRALKPAQTRLEFYDGPRSHPVRFETTDEDELVGAFADEKDRFPGFSVGPGKTLSVKVRLALTADAVPNQVTAMAAVVQRHDDDGEWVGQSNAYRFAVKGESGDLPESEPKSDASPAPRDSPFPFADELAHTGFASSRGILAAALCCLGVGLALVLARKRR